MTLKQENEKLKEAMKVFNNVMQVVFADPVINKIALERYSSVFEIAVAQMEEIQSSLSSQGEGGELPDWSIPKENDTIDVPDELMPLFNKIGMQLRFHTLSGKNEVITIAHIVQKAQEFFTGVKYIKK